MRGKQAPRRKVAADPKYNNPVITKCIDYLMIGGKRQLAQKIVYGALEIAEKKLEKPAAEVFEEAMKNVSPTLEVKSRRVGGANYQVPREVPQQRRVSLAYRWLINAARAKKGKPMAEKLANEILAAVKNEGEAIKKKEDMHRMADANKAFAHFAW